jgi:RND family efflux transporter MFP subunit
MNEIISSQKRPTAAKAAWFGGPVRTAVDTCTSNVLQETKLKTQGPSTRALSRKLDTRSLGMTGRYGYGSKDIICAAVYNAVRFRGGLSNVLEGRGFSRDSRTLVEGQGCICAACARVEAPGFSPAKIRPSLTWALALVAILAALLSVAACSSEPHTVSAAPEVVRDVQLLTAQRGTVPDWLDAVGTLQAAQTSQLSSQITGNIVAMRVREGDRVQRGQVLAVLEDAQPQAAAQQAQAAENAAQQEIVAADSDYSLAEATFKRYQDLYNKKSVSPQEFDEIKAREQAATARRQLAQAGLAQAQAALAQAQTTLGYTRVRAPFDGVVTEKRVDPGTLASPGMPLLVVEDQRRFRLQSSVDEGDIHLVKLGQAVPVTLDSLPGAEFSARVAQIVPAADPASRSFVVKIELPADARLRSGLFGRAHIARGQRQAILLPRSAVLDRGQLQGIYVVGQDRVAMLRYVTLGTGQGEQVEVLSGLQGGERVVAAPGDRELGGKRVENN